MQTVITLHRQVEFRSCVILMVKQLRSPAHCVMLQNFLYLGVMLYFPHRERHIFNQCHAQGDRDFILTWQMSVTADAADRLLAWIIFDKLLQIQLFISVQSTDVEKWRGMACAQLCVRCCAATSRGASEPVANSAVS